MPSATLLRDPRVVLTALLLLAGLLVPLLANNFQISFASRIVVWTIAAISLNIILGYGGMVSFGHAAYLGIGGYVMGIMAFHGVTSGFLQFPAAMLASALWALAVGALSLRTRGVYFIMITLAFAQLIYFVAVGLEAYGGDDGLTIYHRSEFAGILSLKDRTTFYWTCFALMLGTFYLCHRLVDSRFGMVLRGSKSNDLRMRALGFPTTRYRLTAFTLAGAICGLAGVLLANQTDFISPAMMRWTASGDLIVIVVLGGMGSLFGPLYGAIAFFVLEEYLKPAIDLLHPGWGNYWQIIFGPLLIVVALYARGGLDSLFGRSTMGARRG
ncbi:MAG: branched-chain amino acid ABC transporter permease [Rhodospirillales bacterium]